MHRICSSLAENGYDVTLVGYKKPSSLPLANKKFKQKRIHCWFLKGKPFYGEYNIRLFLYLLFKKIDAICAIDLDTIVPCLNISRWKKIPRVYDAHELFTGLKEVVERPVVHKVWTKVEQRIVPKYQKGYTVGEAIAEEFKKRYGVNYLTIRNIPVLTPLEEKPKTNKHLLYQGAINEGRGFEYLIPAMQWVNATLIICGDGNFMPQLKKLIKDWKVEEKVELKGMMLPEELAVFSQSAYIGIATPENKGLNQYLALPNKFFDYLHAGLPQINVNYPEYKKLNDQFKVAILLNDLSPENIAKQINNLLEDDVLYIKLKENCIKARTVLNWQNEQKILLNFYQSLFKN
ncbi:MAG: glycosyltransferase [Chitinophagaceae bacterium]|nr:glycosyltransferase [Chitinophagaceae bacterium]